MAAFSYAFKLPGLVKADAQEVGELFERLEASPEGLTPTSVLNASRDEQSLLHNEFEWDDTVAAEQYRKSQARAIIQNLTVVTNTTDVEEREQHADRAYVITPGYKGAYVSLDNALNREEWRAHLLKTALRDMDVFTAKYQRLSELAAVVQAMESAKHNLQ